MGTGNKCTGTASSKFCSCHLLHIILKIGQTRLNNSEWKYYCFNIKYMYLSSPIIFPVKSPASPRVLETVMAKRTKEFSMKQQEKELETK